LKSSIVSQDEKDRGMRAILNFGHTLGHAIESLQDYKKWRHGEAVGLGMVAALHLSIQRNGVEESLLDRLITLLNSAKLPIKLPKGITDAVILAKMKQDKKQNQGNLPWVLLKALGSACPGNVVLPEELHQALTFVQA
jgi:3-dehydroquinate synthase